jgi:DNA-binding transcriptional LysR family regulator
VARAAVCHIDVTYPGGRAVPGSRTVTLPLRHRTVSRGMAEAHACERGLRSPPEARCGRRLIRQAGACASSVKQFARHVGALALQVNLFWAPAQLAVLAKVVDLNGFSAAARTLGVPKAAVSRAVADLEKTLGVRVLERTTRRIALTPAGRLVYPHAKRVVEELDAAHVLIAKLHSQNSGPLRVVADSTYGRVLLAPLVPRFLESFPDVPLDVSLHDTGSAGTWDVAIRARLPEDTSVEHRLLGALPAVLCATPQYLAQRGVPARPEDLQQHDLFTPESDRPDLYRIELSRNSQRAEVRVVPRLTVNDPAVLHASAAAGLGIGLLPEFLCRQGLATGRLQQVLKDWSLPPAASLYAVYPATLAADSRVQRFVDFLAANIVPALAHG